MRTVAWIDRRGLLIGFVAVVLFIGVYVVRIGIYDRAAPDLDSVAAHMSACMDGGEAVPCLRSAIRPLIGGMEGTLIMGALESRLTSLQCHQAGHVVGEQLYLHYGDIEAALASCSRACDSACVHGAIGEAFLAELGYDASDIDLRHLGPEAVRSIGRELCRAPQACHGVGHAVFQAFGTTSRALAMCREIGTEMMNYCFHGVFMEFADTLQSKSVHPVAGVQVPAVEDLHSLCQYSSNTERRACFRYFPRMVVATLEAQGISRSEAREQFLDICATFQSAQDRISCYAGYGSYSSFVAMTDTQAAVDVCQGVPGEVYRKSCSLGLVSVSTEERQQKVAAYCHALPTDDQRASCFHGMFYYLDRLGTSLGRMEALCGGDPVCLQSSELRQTDPWTLIRD